VKQISGSISKTVMNEVPSVPISDFENEIPPQFPQRGNFARTKGLPSHLPLGDVPGPHGALLTVLEMLTSCQGEMYFKGKNAIILDQNLSSGGHFEIQAVRKIRLDGKRNRLRHVGDGGLDRLN
jgi:hypothetical protein